MISGNTYSVAKSKKKDVKTSRPPPQPTDCRDAMHWFVDSYGQYISSSRGLLVTDVSNDQQAYIESAVVNLRNKGTEPFVVSGEEIVAQSEVIWQKALGNSPYGQPYWSMSEIDFISSEIAMITDMVTPEQPHQLWYLFHLLFGFSSILTFKIR